MEYILIRNVTKKECSWLKRTYKKGEIVYRYNKCTYGCIGPYGIAFSEVPNKEPFFELPYDAVQKIT